MLPWEQRPIEIANLFNPAFCAALLHRSSKGFQSVQSVGIPYALLFLVLPIVLHQRTRNRLPRTTATRMHVWLQNNPDIHIGFVRRAQHLVPHTKEAIMFGLDTQIIEFQDDGTLVWCRNSLRNPSNNPELSELLKKSEFLGRWFAQLNEVSSIFTMWGVRP